MTTAKDNALLTGYELEQFTDFIRQENLIRKESKDNIIKILNHGYKEETERRDLLGMLSRIEHTIQHNQELITNKPGTQIELLKSCSKIALMLTLNTGDTHNTKKELLEKKLLKGAIIKDYDKIKKAINFLYPKSGKHKAVLIGKILNLMSIFRSDDIIGILKYKLRVVSYHEKNQVEPAEYSILDGRALKSYLLFRDREQYNHLFIAGEDSLPALYTIFDIKENPKMVDEIQAAHTKQKLRKTLQGETDIAKEIDTKIQDTLQNSKKLQKLKLEIKKLQEKNKELTMIYNEDILDKLADFQQTQDQSVLLKSLLPSKGFLNWFKAQDNLPTYITTIFNKIKSQGIVTNNEELMILYIYFAQHHRIATSSITSVIDNLNALDTDLRNIKYKLSQEYVSILDIIEIINTAPNYYQEVEAKNEETLNKIATEYNFNLKETLITFWPIFLQSKKKYILEKPELYAMYNQALSVSEQRTIKDLLTKRSFNIPRDVSNISTETETMIHNIKNIEAIPTLKKTIIQLIPLMRKISYHKNQTQNIDTQETQGLSNDKITTLLPTEKAEFKLKIKEETAKNTNHLAKNKYITTEELETYPQHKDFPTDIQAFYTKIDKTAITKEHKRLRDFIYNTEKKPYKQSVLKNIQEEYKAGIISKKSIEIIKKMTEKLNKYQKITQFDTTELKESLKFPHILAFDTIDKTLIQEKQYFTQKQIKDIQKTRKILNIFSKTLKKYHTSEVQFMEQLMFVHENSNKILFTPDENLNPTIEAMNPENFKTTIQGIVKTFDIAKIMRAYDNLLNYQNAEEQSVLIASFQNNKEAINALPETYNINEKILPNLEKTLKLLEKDTNYLASPVIFKYMQNFVNLATKQYNQFNNKDKAHFAALKRQKHYSQYTNTAITKLKIKEVIKGKEQKEEYKELDENLEKTFNSIVEKILDYSRKSSHVSGLIKGVTGRKEGKKNRRNYDPTLSLDNRKIKSFLGKITIKSFLLGQDETYSIPKYIKKNLDEDKYFIDDKIYNRYQREIINIEKYINTTLIRL